jgi:RNA polymerase sigma-70 factor (ECF subfamily)
MVVRLTLGSSAAAPAKAVMDSLRSYSEASDPDLLQWSAAGDRRAFGEVVTRHGPFALRVAARLVADRHAAEDLVQEAMVRAWSQAAHFDPRRARFATWLYRIVVNLCIDHRRRIQPEPLPDNFDPVDTAPAADEAMVLAQRRAALARALADLPVRQRAAMTLVYDEGLSGIEAAEVLGVSAKAVERLLARARGTLRDRLLPRGLGYGDQGC